MKIDCITNSSFCVPKTVVTHSSTVQLSNNKNSQRRNDKSKISFGNKPWELRPRDFGVSNYGSISGDEAIRLYSQLQLGNYLDIGDDSFDFYNCNRIREQNLAFLDRLDYSSDKRQFINFYENLTGFPNLRKVAQKIRGTFVGAVEKAQKDLYWNRFNVVLAGFDGVCSVGRDKAFPGSDLDKAYVILEGSGTSQGDIETVNKFKGKLWEYTDQRLLSYNHDEAAFPQVYTKEQIETLARAVDSKDIPNRRLQPNMHFRSDVGMEQYKLMHDELGRATANYMDDYIGANPFWIEYCRQFPKAGTDAVHIYNPSRENIKNVGFTIEAIREGVVLKGFNSLDIPAAPYEGVNLSQLAALKHHVDRKPKRLLRDALASEFHHWDIDKQLRFIKTMIRSACANNNEFTVEFSKYFSKPGQDMFAPLIKALMG